LTGPLPCTDNFFIVADRGLNNIYQVDASSGATAQLLPVGAANQPTAVAYDPDARSIYWTNGGTNITINKYSLLTNSSTVIYRDAPRPHNLTGNVRRTFTFSIHVFEVCVIGHGGECTV